MKTSIYLLLLFLIIQYPLRAADSVKITILYDNYIPDPRLQSGWGFSCLVEEGNNRILFDGGASGPVLLSNSAILGVSPQSAEIIMISHDHSDHTAGIRTLMSSPSNANVYFGSGFSSTWESVISASGATPHRASDPVQLSAVAHTTGDVPGGVLEQALVISTDSGLVVIVGCSHPGVKTILDRVTQLYNKRLYMVFGGFHWYQMTSDQIAAQIALLLSTGVVKCGATHCTGATAISMLQNAFGQNYIEMGVGKVLKFSTTLVSVPGSENEKKQRHDKTELFQNHPNPLSHSTKIRYQVPGNREQGAGISNSFSNSNSNSISIKVYDVLGREVVTLVNEEKAPGVYEVDFSVAQINYLPLCSGVYFYQLRAGRDVVITKKMILIK